MKVILLHDVKNVGKENEIVEVKDGYATNFLIKQKLAVQVSSSSKSILDAKLKNLDELDKKQRAQALQTRDIIEKIELPFLLKTHNGNVFGSVSIKEIIETMKNKHNITLTKYMFQEDDKKYLLGIHFLNIKLYKEVIAKLKICVQEA